MELSRRQTLSVLGMTAVAAALPASPARAATLPEIMTVIYWPDNEGRVMAGVKCAVPVVSVTAHLFNHERTVEIARYEMGLTPDENPLYGLWRTAQLSGIPLGNYWIDYIATSADGGVASRSLEFFLWLQPTFTAVVTPTAIDDIHRVVTIDGTVVGRHPLTQAVTPIAGMPVGIRASYWPVGLPNPPQIIVTSGPDGSFTGQLTLAGAALIVAVTGGEPREILIAHGGTQGIEVPVDKRPTRLALQLGATAMNLGESTTLDGRLETLVDGQWRPLTGRTVFVGFVPDGGGTGWWQMTSDHQGRFRTTVTPTTSGRYVASFNADAVDQFYTMANAETERLFVRQPVRFDDKYLIVRPTPNPYDVGMWEMDGIIYTPLVPKPVEIQFRPSPTDSWQTMTTVLADRASNTDGRGFRGEFQLPANGQVRAYAAETAHTQAAASKIVAVMIPVPRRFTGSGNQSPPVPRR